MATGDFVVEDPHEAAGRVTALLDGLAVRTLVHGGGLSRATMLEWLTKQTAWESRDHPRGAGGHDGVLTS